MPTQYCIHHHNSQQKVFLPAVTINGPQYRPTLLHNATLLLLAHSLTHSHPFIYSLSFIHSCTHSLTLIHLLTHTCSFIHELTLSFINSLILIHSLTHAHSFTSLLSFIHSLSLTLANSFTHSHSFIHSLINSLTHSHLTVHELPPSQLKLCITWCHSVMFFPKVLIVHTNSDLSASKKSQAGVHRQSWVKLKPRCLRLSSPPRAWVHSYTCIRWQSSAHNARPHCSLCINAPHGQQNTIPTFIQCTFLSS